MSDLTFFSNDFSGQKIRTTANKEFSVYDVMVAFGCYPDTDTARKTFKRLQDKHPKLRTLCPDYKFPGKGQRNTPIADEEGIYQVLMVCPGQRADDFREWAAGIIANPGKALNHAIAKYKRQGRTDHWIEKRFKGIISRHALTDVLKSHGVEGKGYAMCSDAVNVNLLGKTAQELRTERGVKRTRDGMDDVEIVATDLVETIARKNIETEALQGNFECRDACADAAKKVRRVFE